MSFQAMSWASTQTAGSPSRKLVLYALANHANSDGYCRLSYETIASESELSVPGVKKVAKQLEDAGLVRRERIRKANGHLGCYEFYLAVQGPEVSLDQGPQVSHKDLEPVRTRPEPVRTQDLAATPRTRADRDQIWDALTDVFGPPLTRTAESLRGRIVSSLLQAGATPEQIRESREAYRERMPAGTTFTETALEKHWSLLQQSVEAVKGATPNMKYGRRDVSGAEFRALADRLKAERLEGRELASG